MEEEKIRLSKLMTERGVCSRREADLYIKRGWVRVNGEVINTLGTKVTRDITLEISGDAVEEQESKVTIILHKPVGYVSTQPEKGYRPAIDLITPENQDPQYPGPELQRHQRKKLAVAGRLDIDSKGLLVLTQDGRVAKEIIGENSGMEKEYRVWVKGQVTEKALEKLRHGLSLDNVQLKPAQVKDLGQGELRFILKQGRKRQIRRMCELVGLHVKGILRIRVGKIELGDLKEGMWRFIRPEERF